MDGRTARYTGTTTLFSLYADALADAAFWTWITWARDDDRTLKVAALLAWLAPIAAVTAASLTRGEVVEPPRPQRVLPAAALRVLITVRELLDTIKSPPRRRARPGEDARLV